MRVLVVDDSLLARMLLRDAIADLGHECVTARNGDEAWRELQASDFDIVVSDWVMPELDGYELCQRIRTRADAPYVYFVFLTVLHDASHAVAGLKAGADHYLPKPLDPAELAATLQAATKIITLQRRRRALIEIARHLAAERDPEQLLRYLANQTRDLLDAESACVYTGEGSEGCGMQRLRRTAPTESAATFWPQRLLAEEGDIGVAWSDLQAGTLRSRRPGALPDADDDQQARPFPSRDTLIAPISHGGSRLGLLVARRTREQGFGEDAQEILDILAAMTATVLINRERAELVQVVVAARELAHLLNNKLGAAIGTFDLIAREDSLSPELQELAIIANDGLQTGSVRIRQFQSQTRGDEAQPRTASSVPSAITERRVGGPAQP